MNRTDDPHQPEAAILPEPGHATRAAILRALADADAPPVSSAWAAAALVEGVEAAGDDL